MIQRDHGAIRRPHHRKTAAAQITRLGIGHRQRKTDRYRRIYGVATSFEDLGTHSARLRRRGRHHALTPDSAGFS